MKKTLLCAIIALVSSIATVDAQKQPIGTWEIVSTYAKPAQKVIEAGDMVYYLTGGMLFSYDKKADESYSYTIGNKLNDNSITNIYYNKDKKYLFVAYATGNIDLLYDDGHVKNISDIKDANINVSPQITNVAFDGDDIFAATEFGIVRFNEPRGEVVKSGNFGKRINAIAVMGNRLVIHTDEKFYWIDKNSNLNLLDKFQPLYNHNTPVELYPVDDNNLLVLLNNKDVLLAKHEINFETGQMIWHNFSPVYSDIPKYLSPGKNGNYYFVADNTLYKLNDTFDDEVKLCELPDELKDSKIGTSSGLESIWSLKDDEGLGNYTLDGDGGMTVNIDRFKPDGFTVPKVRFFYPSADGKRLYAQNSGVTGYKFGESTRGLDYPQTGGCIDLETGEMTDMTPFVEARAEVVVNQQRAYGKYAISPTGLAEDPNDPSVCFIASADDGIYKIKDGKYVGRYDDLNSPIQMFDNRYIVYGIGFDKGGNLVASLFHCQWNMSPVIILPKDKVKLDPSEVKKEDWIHPNLRDVEFWGEMDLRLLQLKHSNYFLILTAGGDILFVYDTRGTYDNFKDDRWHLWEEFVDQDGKKVDPQFKPSLVEDNNGRVWMGTSEGIYEMSGSNLMNSSMRVTHLKVNRNDGSNLADYLLGTDLIMDISVDAANRKWVATSKSGLFLVSAAGDEILANFNTDNSPLPTNYINCVYADKNSGKIYIGTDYGLLIYTSDATPAGVDYSDVFIYPNPVKPDYHGDINITGLMENSLVKIADVSGSVVYQGRSEGGRFVWNGCNASGRRVKTGVYYVLMSQNANGSSSAAVGKIMVVN